MRWLVTGAGGQLGHHLMRVLSSSDVIGVTRTELDITSASAVHEAVDVIRPDVVINAAAYTAVDAAEGAEQQAQAVNVDGPTNLARSVADRSGCRLIQVSTDYVFDGSATHPYEVDDPPAPRTAYGRTKLAGERAALAALPDRCHVVRTAWVYGGPGPNFVGTMLRLEGERDTVDVVADQIGSPTWAGDLATALVELGRSTVAGGLLHYVNGGTASWFDLAQETFRMAGADPSRVRPVTSDAFPRPAPRPSWSVLSTAAWTESGLSAPRDWREALRQYFSD